MKEEVFKAILKDVQIGILSNVKTREYVHTFEQCNDDLLQRVLTHYIDKGYKATWAGLKMYIRWQ